MLPYFQQIGERIERVWLSRSYDEDIFPQLVLDELEKDPPCGQVEVADIIDWIFGPSQDFRQPNTTGHLFGEPPIMLFQAPRFYIEALFWLSSTTEIHEHGFSGVFAVLAGSSVHSHWHFSPERAINSRMLCGRLERVMTEILRPGGMRLIHSGDRLIHQLFHLDVPSVTIVIRTYVDRNHLPQFNYLPPGLAVDPEDRDGLRTRRLIFLEDMASGHISGLQEYARKVIENGDLETIYYTFSMLTRKRIDKRLLDDLYGVARKRHGEIADLFRQVCEGERRTRVVTSLRSKIINPDARFLLALLMLMPDRDAIFETIRLQFPDIEPLAAIEAWLKNIPEKDTIGFEFNDFNRSVFRSLVEGLHPDALLQRLQTECLGNSIEMHRDRLLEHAKKLAKSLLFYPLFSRSPLREEASS
jgi:hypothetical protein